MTELAEVVPEHQSADGGKLIGVLIVEPAYDGYRLDKYLSAKLGKLSRTRVQAIIERDVMQDERVFKASSTVRTGMRVRIRRQVQDEPETPTTFETLYLDDHLLIIDKPAGLPVHPSSRYHHGTVVGRISERYGRGFASPVHRLDRETSGVLVCARTPPALRKLSNDFFTGRIAKTYLAIVHGHPPSDRFTIDAPIADGSAIVRIAVHIDANAGRPSVTDVVVRRRVIYGGRPLSLVEASPRTGRQHQIRVHLAHVGHGLVGDKIYPDGAIYDRFTKHTTTDEDRARLMIDRQALHAAAVVFAHPITNVAMRIQAAMPHELTALIQDG